MSIEGEPDRVPPAAGVLPGSKKHRSLWLQEVLGEAPETEPPLRGQARTDIAILGGGYVGLWTAIRIKEWDPACEVTILEQDICGGGASGRNGGFVLAWWAKIGTLIKLAGQEEGIRLGRASASAITEIKQFCERHGIEAHFRQSGWLWTATTTAQLGAWEGSVSMCEKLGVDVFLRLPPDEIVRRTGSRSHRGGVWETTGATVQPAALARGLRRVALELGVRIYEGSRAVEFKREYPPKIETDEGRLTAEKVVIAMNGWAAGLPELRRELVVVSSDMVATARVPERLAEIGWTGGECIADSQQMVDYYRTTRDGRVAFGKGGWGIALGGRIGPGFDRNPSRAQDVKADWHRVYPMLADVPLEYDWSGPVDRSVSGIPIFGRLGGRDHLLYGVGWSGNGVGPSVIGGKILASLALGLENEWSRTPLVDQKKGRFPPNPVRYIGAHLVREAVRRKERAEAQGRSPNRLAVTLSKLAPAGLEDH
jgi:putative aminophosphonate oxidoreductase